MFEPNKFGGVGKKSTWGRVGARVGVRGTGGQVMCQVGVKGTVRLGLGSRLGLGLGLGLGSVIVRGASTEPS